MNTTQKEIQDAIRRTETRDYQIIDSRTQKVVKVVKGLRKALNTIDRLDAKNGAYRYVWEHV